MQTKDNAQFHIVLVKGWIEKDGWFLLAQRGSKELHKPGVWSLPGGKVEKEVGKGILLNTLKTEILEEVNVEIEDEIELVYENAFVRVDGAHVVNLTFLCQYKTGEPKPSEDTTEIRWFSIDELKRFPEAEDFLENEIEALSNYLEKRALASKANLGSDLI